MNGYGLYLQTVGNKAIPPHFKPIWFLPTQKTNTEKNQKSLNLGPHTKNYMTMESLTSNKTYGHNKIGLQKLIDILGVTNIKHEC